MVGFLIFFGVLLVVYNIYVIFTQIWKGNNLARHDRIIWAITLFLIPFYGLWMWNYRKSKLKNKNILRY